ncbi:MAG: hypothetical protein WCJ84_06475 [Candidatus Peregrinibacteria bacterium]
MLYPILGIALAYVMIKYREIIIDFSGKFDWAEKYLGNSYNAVILFAIFIFFFSLTFLFGEQSSVFGGFGKFLAGKQ